ncbi:MAG: CHASE2 domain-containing protein, partial [Hyphomicrobiaceae bacterium]
MASTKAQVPAGSRFPVASLLLALAASVAVAVLVLGASHIPGLLRLEYSSADLRTALFSQRVTADHPRVAVVAISDETLRTFATKSPIDRGFLAQLVAAIDKAGAHAIGLDVFMLRPTESSKDTALHNALRDAKAQIVMGVLDERDRAAAGQRAYQAEFVAGTGRPTGYLALRYERDGVVRNVAGPARNSAFPDSFSLQLARSIKPD